MKTKFYGFAVIVVLFYCCQKKDWTGSDENGIPTDSVEISGVNNEMLKKWFSLNRESDSIMNAAELIINQQREELESHPQDEREYINTHINEAEEHLEKMKKKLRYIKKFASNIESYDPALQPKIDSLKEDYINEELKLKDALKQLW